VLKGPTYDFELILPDGRKYRFKVFLGINQGIGGTQLREEMSI
jgi:hypothetical protein